MTPPRSPHFGGAVLAGGASRRMGRDKAAIEIGGVPMLARVVGALTVAGADPVLVVGATEARVGCGVTMIEDRYPGEGPLGAVITALGAVQRDVVVVMSCDLLEPSELAVREVVGALGHADVAVPVVDGWYQWHHCAWHRRVLPRLETAFDAGVRAPRVAAADLDVRRVQVSHGAWLADADHPEDLPPTAH